MIRILHIYKDYYPILGGIENHIRFLCTELAKDKNFQVQVLVANENLKTVIEKHDNFEVIKAGRICKFASTPISFSLFKWIAKSKPDIVHLHFPFPPGEIGCLFWGHYKKMIVSYHNDIVRQELLRLLYTPFLKKLLEKSDVIIASSPVYVKNSRYLSEHSSKCIIIPEFIDTLPFQRRDEKKIDDIKSKYGSPLVLFVGKFRYYKGIEYLIQGAEKVDSKLLLIGSGYLENDLKNLVQRMKLNDRVYFINNVDDENLPSYYHASDILVLPSIHRTEGFGMALLEGMICGLPVISTEIKTGTSWVNLHNQTGLVVPPRDPVALSNAINYLLAHEGKRLQFGKAGIDRVKNNFSKEIVVSQIKKLYYQLLNNNPK
jgi:rhamnosyl/mannosyltransferase